MIDWTGRSRQPCPECDHGPRDTALKVWIDDGNAVCNRCGSKFYRDDLPRRAAPVARPAPSAAAIRDQQWKHDAATRVLRDSRAITADTPAGQYLLATRQVPLPLSDSDLRWVDHIDIFGLKGPALIGRMTLAENHRETRGVHITGLQQDADGTWRRTERRYLGPKSGCVVRLWADECVSTGLAIGEGIETCLALGHAYRPVWACMDAGNLSTFPVLPGVESLLIAADHDDAGIRAAEACAERWAAAGVEVRIALPPAPKMDINDLAVAA